MDPFYRRSISFFGLGNKIEEDKTRNTNSAPLIDRHLLLDTLHNIKVLRSRLILGPRLGLGQVGPDLLDANAVLRASAVVDIPGDVLKGLVPREVDGGWADTIGQREGLVVPIANFG